MTTKLTINLSAEMADGLTELAREVGITRTEIIRRALGLTSIVHGLLNEQDTDQSAYICTKGADGEFEQRHVLSPMLY